MYTNDIKNIDVTLKDLKSRFERFESICADIKYIDETIGKYILEKAGKTYGQKDVYTNNLFNSRLSTVGKFDNKSFMVEYKVQFSSGKRLLLQADEIFWEDYTFNIKFYMSNQYARYLYGSFYTFDNKSMEYRRIHNDFAKEVERRSEAMRKIEKMTTPQSFRTKEAVVDFLMTYASKVDDFDGLVRHFNKIEKLNTIKSICKEKS